MAEAIKEKTGKMKVSKKVYEAVKAAHKHWKENLSEEPWNVKFEAKHCPLCLLAYKDGDQEKCIINKTTGEMCPIARYSGKIGCKNTPWVDVRTVTLQIQNLYEDMRSSNPSVFYLQIYRSRRIYQRKAIERECKFIGKVLKACKVKKK